MSGQQVLLLGSRTAGSRAAAPRGSRGQTDRDSDHGGSRTGDGLGLVQRGGPSPAQHAGGAPPGGAPGRTRGLGRPGDAALGL